MKSTALVCALVAAALGMSSLSFAQEHERRGSSHESSRSEQRSTETQNRGNSGFDPRNAHPQERSAARQDDQNNQSHAHAGNHARDEPQLNAHGQQFHRGNRIPQEYRNRQYVVDDWRTHRLSTPPRGHQWIQVGADYVLVAIATGIIAQLVLSQ